MVQREMEKPGSGDKVDCTPEQMGRFAALVPIPKGKDRAASCRPPSVLAPGSALGSCRHGALSSAQAIVHRKCRRTTPGNDLDRSVTRRPTRLAGRLPPFSRRIQLAVALGEDRPVAAGQFVRGRRRSRSHCASGPRCNAPRTPRRSAGRRPGSSGVLTRMHSPLRVLCQRSILPLLWG